MSCLNAKVKTSRDQNVPKVTASPDVIGVFLRMLARDGHRVAKLNNGGVVKKKTIVCDGAFTTLKYVPTNDRRKAAIRMKDIWEIRVGSECTATMRKANLPDDTLAFSIITKDGKNWNIVCDSERELENWVQSLAFLVRSNRAVLDENPQKARLLELWLNADENNDKKLTFRELAGIVDRMNIFIDPVTLKKRMTTYDKDQNGTLDFNEFGELVTSLSAKPELLPLFRKFAVAMPDIGMTSGELVQFLKVCQGETISPEMALGIIEMYTITQGDENNVLSFNDFCGFILSPQRNPAVHPRHQTVYQDMTQPLHHYFIASSHNTYLSGDQLQSTSKVEMYKRALLSGCRCVELDCWDGPAEEPVVYHGYTRTTKISFRDVITAIHQSAFETSEYPIILSLEVHTSELQGEVMADIIKSTFGAQLYTGEDAKRDKFSRWSPATLKRKVLVKWKTVDGDDDDKDDKPDEVVQEQSKAGGASHKSSCAALSRLVLCAALKSKDWGESASGNHITSFSEGQVARLGKEHREDFVKQNCRMLARTYPAGSRVDSSNYNPLPAWELGAQAVALNYQTWDRWMRAYDGRFRQNGRCGYVLKPAYLRDASAPVPTQKYTLRVTVLVGSQLPKPDGEHTKGEIIDPYVELTLLGSEADTAANAVQRTKVVNDNGFNPLWNETFTFSVTNMDLALLSLRVLDKDDVSRDDEIGEAVVPLNALNLGYRAVSLSNCATGRALDYATVLCHFALVKE